jgi:hypothetical protein
MIKKWKKEDSDSHTIVYHGVEYAFLIDKKHGVGIRRTDQKDPSNSEIEKVTEYIIAEGWADELQDEEEF